MKQKLTEYCFCDDCGKNVVTVIFLTKEGNTKKVCENCFYKKTKEWRKENETEKS